MFINVYLSSPYEHDRANTEWKNVARKAMIDLDVRIVTIDPCPDTCDETDFINNLTDSGDWLGMYSFCSNFVESDLGIVERCQGMISYLPCDAKTFGTTHEMIYALQNNIPVVMIMPEGIDKVSHWLWGILGPNRIFDNLEEAAETLVKRIQVARGEKANDTVHYPGRTETSR